MNEIVSTSNVLTDLPLRKFNANELDLLMVMCQRLKNKGTTEISLSFREIRNLAHYKPKDTTQLAEDIRSTNKKLLELNIMLRDDEKPGRTVQFALFKRFITDEKAQLLEVSVNEEFQWILNKLIGAPEGYTSFELRQFVELKSSYSKTCYRQLKRYKDTGWWEVDINDFRRLLDIPKSYRMANINQTVLKPIEDELSSIFKHFSITKIPIKKSGRGRPKIEKIRFDFDPEPKWDDGDQEFFKQNRMKKNCNFLCPDCGKPLVEKVINGSNCWCHIDGYKNDATCRRIFNSVAEIEGYEDDKKKSEEEKKTHEKRGFFGKLFG